VLLADSANFTGSLTITAIPLKDPITGSIKTDSIRIAFGSNLYIVDKSGLKVNLVFFINLFLKKNKY
jgi:hypothetical protein